MDQPKMNVSDTDLEILEALVRSGAFASFKRLVESYQAQCQNVLLTSKEPAVLFETQGRIIGSNVCVKLPQLLVQQREMKRKEDVKKQQVEERRKQLADARAKAQEARKQKS